ncbi:ribonuclease III [Candidatus Falkowbacteria bacterium RIFCSPLOWO2_12_FULL_45_10]|uniref:Ribonuclease 3 n=3 Tax=Candidatus Falkowiibacteriota TaxID=1752728 RepID=A0A1F5RXH3_9BACT|nr:MAG: ribonuclease III [Candidatus Falkowbacteria bacterium RIFCSPHIGHO2_02_FULL_45_15]OGF19510.1 MAG: ribonuclease III [Candidatus Falkowbacteria bacterium RIFCSPLOWO2_12_FULL_45_10]OGF20054.1 MAG: ribonuclease III [Candidatus Falkowbacteria bacterium RIFCSPLOWO2_02_FULL_45_15]
MKNIEALEEAIATNFKNKDLLRQAMVHRSYLNEHVHFALDHNERLEFLGDAVLEVVVTEYLYFKFPDKPEGELTNLRASLVNAKMLSRVATALNIEDNLYLSRGEAKDKDSKARQFILADAVEAIIGAVYLDQGMRAAKKFIKNTILCYLDEVISQQLYLDPKSKFQERAQELYGVTPHYVVISENGPDHAKNFEVGVYIGEEFITKGQGTSKQEAQVKAAAAALKKKGW